MHDRDIGLVHFGYRDYDPATGRWTAKDPIGFAGGDTDLYNYVLADPVNAVDPIGLYQYDSKNKSLLFKYGKVVVATAGKIIKTVFSQKNPSSNWQPVRFFPF